MIKEISRSEIIDSAINKIKSLFPKNFGIMITGSVLTEHFNETSDVDVIVLCNCYRKILIESYEHDGRKVQAIILPVYDLDIIFNKDYASGNGAYIRQIFYGKIIEDKYNLLKCLKEKCTNLFLNSKRVTSKFLIDQHRSRITTRLEDLEGNNNWDDILFIILDLYNKISDLFFLINGGWHYSGKLASHVLSNVNKHFKKQFTTSLDRTISNHDKSEAIKFTTEFISNLGGPLHFHTTRLYKESISKDNLIIFIPDENTIFLRENQKYLYNKLTDFISSVSQYIQVFSYICNDHHIYRSGQYIICFGDKEVLNHEILPKIELFHTQLFRTRLHPLAMRMSYPYDINPIEIFGNESMQLNICKFLNTIKENIEQDIETYSLNILLALRKIRIFENNETWKEFWNLAFNINNKIYNPEMLPDKTSEIFEKHRIENYKSKYDSNKNNISNIISNNSQFHKYYVLCSEYLEYINRNFEIDTKYIFNVSVFYKSLNGTLQQNENMIVFTLNLIDAILNTLEIQDKAFIIFSVKQLVSNT